MPFCAAAAIVHRPVGIETFDDEHVRDARVPSLMPRVDDARRSVTRRRGRGAHAGARRDSSRAMAGRSSQYADGARGYPDATRASTRSWTAKFLACARRVLSERPPARALGLPARDRRAGRRSHADRALDASISLEAALRQTRAPLARHCRDVAALPDHERSRELDDGRSVLVHAGRLARGRCPTFGRDFDSRVSSTSLFE